MTVLHPLPYTLHTRYRAIALAWTLITLPPTVINLGLIYGLWYGTNLERALVLTIPLTLLGIGTAVSIIERITLLCSHEPTYRPLNSGRFALDPFMWGYFLSLIMISSEISCGLSLPGAPHLSLISMAAPSLLLLLASILLLSLLLNAAGVLAPFRLGSTGKGEAEVRPAVFYVVEDIVAVDGGGGSEYRTAFNARYASSRVFREMTWWVSVGWMLGFYVVGGLLMGVIWGASAREYGEDVKMVVLGVCWGLPFVLGGIGAAGTVGYVRRCLRRERGGEEEGLEGERRPLLGE